MSRTEEQYSDPLIDEVRARRRKLFAEHGNDLRRLFEAIQRRQAAYPENLADPRESKQHAHEPPSRRGA
jgi:hypothetical protein